MKKLKIFYIKNCPFCKAAFRYIEALKDENDAYRLIEPELIDEEIEVDYADAFDYYNVPSFYIDGNKIHEGAVTKDKVREIFEKVLKE